MNALEEAIADLGLAWEAWASLPTQVVGMEEAFRAVDTWDWVQAAERRVEELRADNKTLCQAEGTNQAC